MEEQESRREDIRESFDKELESVSQNTVLSPAYKKRKIIFWIVRTSIAAVLYVIFWEHEWVRWSLWIVAPLSILSLAAIFAMEYFLKKKIERVHKKLEEVENVAKEEPGEDQ